MILEIFFAAGCFWGVEKNFESIEGVIDVVSGYSGGSYEDPTYEDVLKKYPTIIKKLQKGLSIREIAIIFKCSTTTVNKLRKILVKRNEL